MYPLNGKTPFAAIGSELRHLEPNSVVFYTSGRASIEASYLYQLFARMFGTNNLPDSSNMCHGSTSVALPQTIGVPVGTIELDDFSKCDAIFYMAQNVGTSAPRLLHELHAAARRGVRLLRLTHYVNRHWRVLLPISNLRRSPNGTYG
jgi:anaerobic selenocysteine-containing dehydrogenase